VISGWDDYCDKLFDFKVSAIMVCPRATLCSSFEAHGDRMHAKLTSKPVGIPLADIGKELKCHIQE
jgi:hypothetical protein